MSNTKSTVDYILSRLGNATRISSKYDHGENKIIADGKEVAIISDDQLYVPICQESAPLEKLCETDVPYLGAPLHYVLNERQVGEIHTLSKILLAIAHNDSV